MLRKRIIFVLIYADGYFYQSRNFRLQRVGDLKWLETNYNFPETAKSIDELIVLNASRDCKDITLFSEAISAIVKNIFIPIAAGGGINSMLDAKKLLESGADKIVLNSAIFHHSNCVHEIADLFGSQCIIASIDYKTHHDQLTVFSNNGSIPEHSLEKHLQHTNKLPIGEILLNSMDRDGTGFGFDIDTVNLLDQKNTHSRPVILSGGAGNYKHFEQAFLQTNITALATANLFNFIGDGLEFARSFLLQEGFNLADWRNIDA